MHTASGSPAVPEDAGSSSKPAEKKGLLQSIKKLFVGDKMDKERLAALGMGAFASYAVISNVTYGTCLTIAWISFVKAYNVSPLAPGQWKGFLVFYAGLFTFQNIVRPLRFTAAIALAPLFDQGIDTISKHTGLTKKWAFGTLLVCIASTTTVVLFGTIHLLGGFPPVK